MKTVIYTLSALAIATSLSFAQDTPAAPAKRERPSPEESFKKLDKDNDGSLTLEEYKANPRQKDPAKAEASYKKMDADSNGKVTLDEYKAARATRRQGGADKGGNTPPPADPAK